MVINHRAYIAAVYNTTIHCHNMARRRGTITVVPENTANR